LTNSHESSKPESIMGKGNNSHRKETKKPKQEKPKPLKKRA
jgi:hypothetical protein